MEFSLRSTASVGELRLAVLNLRLSGN